ncbi:hypothetical protein GCM10009798_16270 [Nocardioides panacihumi]|uniref:Flagellar protein n=1 Tax=Nocardioides panacihumi TaxID=400774 RepID=A0ABP5C7M7_9ACTN
MDMLGLVVRLVCSLAVVLGLLLLIARFAGKRFQGRTGAPVQILHRQPISRGSSVAVVSVGTRILVLGTTEQQVTLLTELEPDEIGVDVTEPVAVETPEPARHRSGPTAATTPLAGSLLSGQTWKQALAAATRAPAPSASVPTSTISEKQAS